MKNHIVLTILFLFLFMSFAFAEISLEARIDKKEITADELITYKLIITTTEKKISQPTVPKFTGFQVVSQAQSSTVSFAKNNIKTIVVYAFVLAPEAEGKFTIEPSTLKLKNSLISSAAFEIEVKPGKRKPQPKPEEKSSPQKPRRPSDQPQITL